MTTPFHHLADTQITTEYLSGLAPDGQQLVIDEGAFISSIPTIAVLNKVLRSIPTGSIAFVIGHAGPIVITGSEFEPQSPLYQTPSALLLFEGEFSLNEHEFTHLFLGYGDRVACATMSAIIGKSTNILKCVTSQDPNGVLQMPAQMTQLEAIPQETILAYTADERGLYHLLAQEAVPQASKIISTLASLYPYVRDRMPSSVTLTPLVWDQRNQPGMRPGRATDQGEDSRGEELILLATYVLGPAYSNRERIRDQLARRIRAIAAATGSPAPEPAIISQVFTNSRFDPQHTSSAVDDVLGAVVAIDKTGAIRHNAKLTELASIDDIRANYSITPHAAELLEQARLVYSHYHATSIHFVLPIYSELSALITDKDTVFREEITKFSEIRDDVLWAPYLGVRAKLPPQYHIKNYARLVYAGLLYHKASLTSDADRELFADYKISDIKSHVGSTQYQAMVESIVAIIPPATTQTLVILLQTLTLAQSERLLAGKTEAQRRELLELLRGADPRGAWADAMIKEEDANYMIQVAADATSLLKERMDEQYQLLYADASDIEEPVLRRESLGRLREWKRSMTTKITNITSLESRLAVVRTPSALHIRDGIVKILDSLAEQIAKGPEERIQDME